MVMRCYTRAFCQQENILIWFTTQNIIPGFDHCSHTPEPPPGLLSDLGGPEQPGICWFEGDTATKGEQFDEQDKQQTPYTKENTW